MSRNSPSDFVNEVADFLQLSRIGDLTSMKEIKAKSNIDVNSVSVTGHTALMFASIGSVASVIHPDSFSHREIATPAEITEWLLSQGADQNLVDKNGYRAIHYAAKNGLKDVVEILIENNKFLIESNVKGWRPLHFAAANNHLDLADFLISKGAEVNAEIDYEGRKYRVLDLVGHIPLESDREEMSQLILRKSAITMTTGEVLSLMSSRIIEPIPEGGLSLPRARSLSDDKSEGVELG
ncbi:MAG: ankyrin repeat domain-containing protein [Rickettsiales bacterium]|nr:ankyrin repeat domain-containing protein [Rickettsiales bacterium]